MFDLGQVTFVFWGSSPHLWNGDKDTFSVVRIKLDDNSTHHTACRVRCSKITASVPGAWSPGYLAIYCPTSWHPLLMGQLVSEGLRVHNGRGLWELTLPWVPGTRQSQSLIKKSWTGGGKSEQQSNTWVRCAALLLAVFRCCAGAEAEILTAIKHPRKAQCHWRRLSDPEARSFACAARRDTQLLAGLPALSEQHMFVGFSVWFVLILM